jgi:hypothetical protein
MKTSQIGEDGVISDDARESDLPHIIESKDKELGPGRFHCSRDARFQ